MSAPFEAFGGEPAPADLDAVRGLSGLLVGTADAARVVNQTVAGIAEGADSSVWSGESAEAFRAKLHDLPELVGKVERSYGDAAEAVQAFLVSADQVRADAAGLAVSAGAVSDESAAVGVLDPASPETPVRHAASAQAVADMAAKVAALQGDYGRAETVLIDALAEAKKEGIPPDSFWHKLVVSVEEWSAELGLALGAAVALAGAILVVATMVYTGAGLLLAIGAVLQILGPFVTAMMVAAVAHLAAGVVHKAEYGDDGSAPSWASLAVETAFMVVPFGVGKAFKPLAAAGREGEEPLRCRAASGQGVQRAVPGGRGRADRQGRWYRRSTVSCWCRG